MQGVIGDHDDPASREVRSDRPKYQPRKFLRGGAHLVRRRFGVAQEITELRGRLRYLTAVAEVHDPHVIPSDDEREHLFRAARIFDQKLHRVA